jgi:hypothetical protein
MHDHDLDLIAAFAEGSASDAEAARARGWISTCEVCSQEFEYQQLALASLGDVEPVVLSDIERALLHRRVRESIASDELATRPEARPAPRSGRWMKVLTGSAAAVLVLVVGFGVIIPSFTGTDGAADFAAETADTIAEAAQAPAGAALTANDDTSIASAAAGVGELAIPPPVQAFGDLTLEDLTAMAAPIEMFDATDATVTAFEEAPRDAPIPADRMAYDRAVEEPLNCREEGLALLDSEVLWLGIATLDGQIIELYRSEPKLLALEAGTCTIVFPTE